MGTLLVVTLSLLVGAGTYIATIRSGRRSPVAVGFDGGPGVSGSSALQPEPLEDGGSFETPVAPPFGLTEAPERGADIFDLEFAPPPTVGGPTHALGTVRSPDPGYTYLQVATHGPDWKDRIAGIAGLIVILVLGAAALAFALYQAGSVVNTTVERFFAG